VTIPEMATAVCIRCGFLKHRAFTRCRKCGYCPEGDRRAKAQSLLLSTEYHDAETDRRPTRQELALVAERIRSGVPVPWDEATIARLIAEQELLEQGPPPRWRDMIVIGLLFLIPLASLVVIVLDWLL